MNNSAIYRILGDLLGCTALAVFIALLIYPVTDLGSVPQRSAWFVGVYAALAIAAIFIWRRMNGGRKQWLNQALFSVVTGIAWLLIDVAAGYLRDPSSPLLEAVATSRLFFITLLLCPGYTAIALSGWVRSFVVGEATQGQTPSV